jgi:hypothetical protein
MSMSPRNRPVFEMPEIKNRNTKSVSSDRVLEPVRTISVSELTFDSARLHLISGLGAGSVSLSWTDFNSPSYSEEKAGNAPSASMNLELPIGRHMIELRCVPTHAVHEKRALRTAICLGDNPPAFVDVNTPSGTEAWSKNIIRGYSSAKTEFILKEKGMVTLQLSLLDPGLAISKILIY